MRLRRGNRAQTTQNASFGHPVSFFLLSVFFFSLQIIFIGTTSILELQTDYLEAMTRESGSNDSSWVIWAICEFFFSIIALLNHVFSIIGIIEVLRNLLEGTTG